MLVCMMKSTAASIGSMARDVFKCAPKWPNGKSAILNGHGIFKVFLPVVELLLILEWAHD